MRAGAALALVAAVVGGCGVGGDDGTVRACALISPAALEQFMDAPIELDSEGPEDCTVTSGPDQQLTVLLLHEDPDRSSFERYLADVDVTGDLGAYLPVGAAGATYRSEDGRGGAVAWYGGWQVYSTGDVPPVQIGALVVDAVARLAER